MAGETLITIVGNLVADPEIRYTPQGVAVANFTVASTSRTFNKQDNRWVDGDTVFMRCSIWRGAAENAAESLRKGTRVIVTGRLVSRTYETREGEKRTTMELQADDIGASVKLATVTVNKATRRSESGGGDTGDPWASSPPMGTSRDDEIPF
jgi:single-strand DNA-binding protein